MTSSWGEKLVWEGTRLILIRVRVRFTLRGKGGQRGISVHGRGVEKEGEEAWKRLHTSSTSLGRIGSNRIKVEAAFRPSTASFSFSKEEGKGWTRSGLLTGSGLRRSDKCKRGRKRGVGEGKGGEGRGKREEE
jgi:hypothetical protein